MPGRHLVDAHCSGADRRPRLTHDDRRRGATANQAGNRERSCANAKKFHANLTSCRIAKLRFNVLAAAVGRLWHGGRNAISNATGYAKHRSRSHYGVIRVYDKAGNVIETHEHRSGSLSMKADDPPFLGRNKHRSQRAFRSSRRLRRHWRK